MTSSVSVIVLAGGESRRFGGDKLAAVLQGMTLLDHLLTSLPAHWPVILVGEPRRTAREVTWTREHPPGGGPLAGIAAGAAVARSQLLAVVAGDMPWAGGALPSLVEALTAGAASGGSTERAISAAIARDDAGQANPLLGAYRRSHLLAHLPQPAHGRPAKQLLGLPHVEVSVTGLASRDVDTSEDLAALIGSLRSD